MNTELLVVAGVPVLTSVARVVMVWLALRGSRPHARPPILRALAPLLRINPRARP